jgi:hypothetical protein
MVRQTLLYLERNAHAQPFANANFADAVDRVG